MAFADYCEDKIYKSIKIRQKTLGTICTVCRTKFAYILKYVGIYAYTHNGVIVVKHYTSD